MSGRVLFYVQHLLGVGHVRRAASIARAMAAHGLDVSLALGGFPVKLADFTGARLYQLPPARSADMSFSTLLDAEGNAVDEAWWDERRARLMALYRQVNPDIVLIEHFPFGRSMFRRELLPVLEHARGRAKIISSVRDVLVAKNDKKKLRKITDLIERHFDHILVHGQADLIPFEVSFPAAARFADKISYTGYVTDDAPDMGYDKNGGRGEIIVSAGGGAVGKNLLFAGLVAACCGQLKNYQWRILAGDNLDRGDFHALQRQAPENVIVEPARADFKSLLANCALSISQGGYNTMMDIIAARCPNLIVPFSSAGETEQSFRAAQFDKLGLINMFKPDKNGLKSLSGAAIATLKKGPAKTTVINLAGASQSAMIIKKILGE